MTTVCQPRTAPFAATVAMFAMVGSLVVGQMYVTIPDTRPDAGDD
jgi:hypothetical protein